MERAIEIIENEIKRLETLNAKEAFGSMVVQHMIAELKIVLKKIAGVKDGQK